MPELESCIDGEGEVRSHALEVTDTELGSGGTADGFRILLVGHGVEQVTQVVGVGLEGDTLALDGVGPLFRNRPGDGNITEGDVVELAEPAVLYDEVAPAVGVIGPGRSVARIYFVLGIPSS